MAASQASRVVQIVSQDFFVHVTDTARTNNTSFSRYNWAQEAQCIAVYGLAVQLSALKCVWHVSYSLEMVQMATDKRPLIYSLGTCEITKHISDRKSHVFFLPCLKVPLL